MPCLDLIILEGILFGHQKPIKAIYGQNWQHILNALRVFYDGYIMDNFELVNLLGL